MKNTSILVAPAVTQFELSNLIRKTRLFSKIELKASSRLVLESLVYHHPNIRVNIQTLQDETGNSRRSVDNALLELKQQGLILITHTGRSSKYSLTQKFFDLLGIAHQPCRKEPVRHANTACPHNKQKNIPENKENFSFKNILNLLKEDPIKYNQELEKLSEDERERLLKHRLKRMGLTAFQKTNLDKLLMLTDGEIAVVNKKEPYYRQENIDIYYNRRKASIRDTIEKVRQTEEEKNRPVFSEREKMLAMLRCGYKLKKTEHDRAVYLAKHRDKMQEHGINESDLV